ncbi:MAG: sulfite exporter TauE/SafE family protein [Chitinophagaceae bacterium]|nr:sulfite exporter TauE/SafE family protein [Chitinophagaceae bacterium]
MEIIGYLAAVIIGFMLGLAGGGGSILTVPVLVYLFSIEPVIATAYSLFIVGTTSLIGGVKAYTKHDVDFTALSMFGIPSIFTIFIARHFILPELPPVIAGLSKGNFLMVVFAVLMLATSIFMIKPRMQESTEKQITRFKPLSLTLPGLLLGLITGLLGAGGGFLIIPALVLILKLPMRKAIGTSLLIIAINSLFGVLFSLKLFKFHWDFLLLLSGLAIAGVLIGGWLSSRLNNKQLRKFFGFFVLLMGLWILLKELLLK